MSIIKTMHKFMQGNFPSALLMIGGVGLSVHYEQLANSFDGVPLILAWGKPVSGQTTAAKVAMSIIGKRESIGGTVLLSTLLLCEQLLTLKKLFHSV